MEKILSLFNSAKYREWLSLALLILIMCSARSSLADWNRIPSGSMQPTLYIGDMIFVNKLQYDLKIPFTTKHLASWGNPKRGDIVVLFKPDDGLRLIKRVIGVPGDNIAMDNNQLIINGKRISYQNLPKDAYQGLPDQQETIVTFANEVLPEKQHAVMGLPAKQAYRTFSPVNIPEGYFLLLGDNRDGSGDSRYFGLVPRQQIVGKATHVIISWDKDHYYKPRFERFFQKLV